ncbi:MAG: ABC-2 transporter permease [Candidatus Coproplasma sp.]
MKKFTNISRLIQKEFMLCMHPTAFIFLSFCLLALVPNYPYEVIFFFSGLSVFFTCLTSRENGDLSFTCALPVKKQDVPTARILVVVLFQLALIVLTHGVCFIKQALFPAELLVNAAGISANVTLIAHGYVLLGLFNVIFFPLHYKNPKNVGVPFVVAAVAVFACIMILIVLRYATPLWSDILNGEDSYHGAEKACAYLVGQVVYIVLTALALLLSRRNFEKLDL